MREQTRLGKIWFSAYSNGIQFDNDHFDTTALAFHIQTLESKQ